MGLLDGLLAPENADQLAMIAGLLSGKKGENPGMHIAQFAQAQARRQQMKQQEAFQNEQMQMRREDQGMQRDNHAFQRKQQESAQAEAQRKQEAYARLAEKYPQYADMWGIAPDKAIDRVMPKPNMQFAPNGQAVDMATVQNGADFAKQPDWKDPEYVATQKAIRAAGASNVTTSVMPQREIFKDSLALKKDFDGLPEVKGFKEVQGAWDQISTALKNPSPANDLASATKFMKMLDPGSVVRESELMMAMKASGALDRMANYHNRLLKGEKLTPTQRADFFKSGEALYNAAGERYGQTVKQYEGIASQYGLDQQFIPKKQPGAGAKLQVNQTAIYKAKEAIKKGADPEAVKKRMMEQGYDPNF